MPRMLQILGSATTDVPRNFKGVGAIKDLESYIYLHKNENIFRMHFDVN